MKNRFLIFLMAVSVLFSTFNFVYAADSEAFDYRDAEFLDYLGIMQIMEAEDYSKYMTREDFAYSTAVLMGLSDKTDTRYYTDLRAGSFAFGYINSLAKAGVLSPAKDDCFRPLDYITFDEAQKMLVTALGYSPVAEMKGGYPVGYSITARKIGISDGSSGNVCYSDAVNMFYNALKLAPYEISGVSEDGEFYREGNECYANQGFNLNRFKGTVRATQYGNIDDSVILDPNTVKIDEKIYKISESIDTKELLGSYTEFFCTDEEHKSEIVYIKDITREEKLVIDISLFNGYKNDTIEYFSSENASRASSITLAGSTIIYNGLPLRSYIRETFAALNKGTITLKDTDDDKNYDLIDIKDYKNFYIKFIDGSKIYNELSKEDVIDFKEAECITVIKSGSKILESELAANTSISAAVSLDERIVDIVVNDTVTGKYTANLSKEIKIDDKKYKLDRSYKNTFLADAKVGEIYTFWVDLFGNVSYIGAGSGRRMTLGYIIDADKNDDKAFDESLYISLISADGSRVVLECAENIIIDAQRYRKKTPDEILTVLKNGKAHARQLIQYALDKNEMISEIDTIVKNPGEDPEYSLRQAFTKIEKRWYHLGRYGHTAICTNDTVAFCIPDEGVTNEENYYVGKGANTITQSNDDYFELDCYYTGENSPFVDAVIGVVNINKYSPTNVIMYDEGIKAMDDEGNTIYEVSGYNMGVIKEYVLEEDVIGIELIETYNRGDLIVVHTNRTGEVSEIKKVFDAKTKTTIGWEYETDTELLYIDGTPEKHNRYCSELNLSFGYVRKNYGGVISISKTSISEISERIQTNKRLNMLYDSKTDTIELVTDDCIVDYETAGDSCMRAVHHMWYEDGRGVYLYN